MKRGSKKRVMVISKEDYLFVFQIRFYIYIKLMGWHMCIYLSYRRFFVDSDLRLDKLPIYIITLITYTRYMYTMLVKEYKFQLGITVHLSEAQHCGDKKTLELEQN